MARELFQTSLIKLEVIGDDANLHRIRSAWIEAATELGELGLGVFRRTAMALAVCKRLLDCGCEALMSGRTDWHRPRTSQLAGLRELRKRIPDILLSWTLASGFHHTPVKLWSGASMGVPLNTAVSRAIPFAWPRLADSVRAEEVHSSLGPWSRKSSRCPALQSLDVRSLQIQL